MSVEEFIVTLPSNASVTNFPNNKANSYTVALPKTLALDGDFEVAVGDLQYPHNWTNFEEEYIAFARVDPENINYQGIGIISLQGEYEKGLETSKKDAIGDKLIDNLDKDVKIRECRGFLYYVIRIPTGYYKDAGEIAKIMVTKFTDLTKRQSLNLEYNYNEKSNTLKLTSTNLTWFRILSQNENLCRILGFGKPTKLDTLYIWDPLAEPKRKPQIDEFSTIYLYTDIIKYQIVGDTQAPLLGTLPVQGKHGEQVYWSFNTNYYMPVNKTSISTIEVRLCNETGDLIPFDPTSTTVCKLHFRRRRGPW